MRCPCRPGWVCFSFSACSLPLLFEFSPERSPVLFRRKRRILRIRGLLLAVAHGNCCSHGFNRAGLWLCWCCSLPGSQNRTQGRTGPVWGCVGVVPLPDSQNRTRMLTGASFVFVPQKEVTPPPKGGGAGYRFSWVRSFLTRRSPVLYRRKRRILRIQGLLSAVALATAGHNRVTLAQQGLFGASLVSFPYPASKTAQRATQGRVWLSLSFPGALLLRQTSKLSFQVVVDSFLDGPDGELQGAIPHLTRLSTYLSGFHIDELFLLQLPNVLGNCVGAHPGVLAYATNAGPALVSFPVLAEHQVSINRQFART